MPRTWLAATVLAALWCSAATGADRSQIVVGPHPATTDQSQLLVRFLQNEINDAGFGRPADLADFIYRHAVKSTPGITDYVPDLKAVYDNQKETLMIAAGLFIESESAFRSTVFMGPVSPEFSVDVARADTLATTAGTRGPTLTRLLLYYAMIRDAKATGQNAGLVVPLVVQACEMAKTVSGQSSDQSAVNVARAIEGDLKKLVRC